MAALIIPDEPLDLRGKTVREVLDMLKGIGYETVYHDVTKIYAFFGNDCMVCCVRLYDPAAERMKFVLWDGRIRQPKPDHDLVIFDPEGDAEWAISNVNLHSH